jgi:hypothetical protein
MGGRLGLELERVCSEIDPEKLRKSLNSYVVAAEKTSAPVKAQLTRARVKSIQYSKEIIRVSLWSDNGEGEVGQEGDESDAHPRKSMIDNELWTDGADSAADVPWRPDVNRDASGQPQGGAKSRADFVQREAEAGGNIYPIFSGTQTKKRTGHNLFDPFDSKIVAPFPQIDSFLRSPW